MKKSKRRAPTESGPVRRSDFETWTAFQDALAASDDLDAFERLLDLPETLADWTDMEETSVRRWFAAQPYPAGPPLEAYLARARERARRNYEATKEIS